MEHLDIRTLWIQSKIKDKEVVLECINGLVNPGDLGTKNMDAEAFAKMCKLNQIYFVKVEDDEEDPDDANLNALEQGDDQDDEYEDFSDLSSAGPRGCRSGIGTLGLQTAR